MQKCVRHSRHPVSERSQVRMCWMVFSRETVLFKASGVGTIAGSYVLDGLFERDCSVRLTRDGIVIFEGPLASLKRFKDDVKEVKAGYECGFVFANFNDIKEGDLVEAFKMVEVPR